MLILQSNRCSDDFGLSRYYLLLPDKSNDEVQNPDRLNWEMSHFESAPLVINVASILTKRLVALDHYIFCDLHFQKLTRSYDSCSSFFLTGFLIICLYYYLFVYFDLCFKFSHCKFWLNHSFKSRFSYNHGEFWKLC